MQVAARGVIVWVEMPDIKAMMKYFQYTPDLVGFVCFPPDFVTVTSNS